MLSVFLRYKLQQFLRWPLVELELMAESRMHNRRRHSRARTIL